MPYGHHNVYVRRNDAKDKFGWGFGKKAVNWFPIDPYQFYDLPRIASDFIFNGPFYPEKPVFDETSGIITMGSCFAQRIREWIKRRGNAAEFVHVPTGLNNSFAIRQYVEWVMTGNRSQDAYWYDDPTGLWVPPEEQQKAKAAFEAAKGFVITFGLAEVWRDKDTGGVFWRGIPNEIFNAEKHECVVSKVSENVENMKRIHELLGGKTLIYTLSPIPLKATFLERPAFISDCVSKSTLRVALEEFFNTKPDNAFYWPAFEFFRWVGSHTKTAMMIDRHDTRGIDERCVEIVLDNFAKRYFQ